MRSILLAAAFAALGSEAFGQNPAPPAGIPDAAFLAGSWELVNGATRVEESWTCPGPDSMYATGRTLANGKTTFFEFLRIEARKDGVFYVAQPKGRPPTDFKLTRHEAGVLVFENPEHDFPKRITYTKSGSDGLVARVEGDASSAEKAEEFRYTRKTAACR
jgi:hypothetical protein